MSLLSPRDEIRAWEAAESFGKAMDRLHADPGVSREELPEIAAGILRLAPRCVHCLDEGFVCEDHPDMPWEGEWGTVEGHREHGGIGMPCPACCSPIPEDGTCSIALAFTPDWRRP